MGDKRFHLFMANYWSWDGIPFDTYQGPFESLEQAQTAANDQYQAKPYDNDALIIELQDDRLVPLLAGAAHDRQTGQALSEFTWERIPDGC